jgi:transcriptional regulator with XRE-family HTH domain
VLVARLRDVDDQRIGALARAIRRRLGWRQVDVAERAGVSQTLYSLFERGHLGLLTVQAVRTICTALEIRLDLVPRWRGGDVDRLVDERHALIAEAAVRETRRWAGWQARAEVTFSFYGERGSIDVFAWNEAARAVLIEEIKSDLTAIEGTLRPLAIKRRLAADIAERELGWRPRAIGVVLILPEGSHVRRRVADHAATSIRRCPRDCPPCERGCGKRAARSARSGSSLSATP